MFCLVIVLETKATLLPPIYSCVQRTWQQYTLNTAVQVHTILQTQHIVVLEYYFLQNVHFPIYLKKAFLTDVILCLYN